MKKEGASENFGMFSTILGILGIAIPFSAIPLSFLSGSVVGFILSIIALVFAYKASSWRKTAFAISIIGIILNIALFMWILAFLSAVGQQLAQSGALDQVSQVQGVVG